MVFLRLHFFWTLPKKRKKWTTPTDTETSSYATLQVHPIYKEAAAESKRRDDEFKQEREALRIEQAATPVSNHFTDFIGKPPTQRTLLCRGLFGLAS